MARVAGATITSDDPDMGHGTWDMDMGRPDGSHVTTGSGENRASHSQQEGDRDLTKATETSRRQRRQQERQERKKRQQQRRAEKESAPMGVQREDDGDDACADDDDDVPPRLTVKLSTIVGAGDGLFLASRRVCAGDSVLEEEAVAIKRPAAKQILAIPKWRHANPIIQAHGDNYFDIRALLLYKSNHADSSSSACNAYCTQLGPTRLALVARRDIWKGEEILWEYAKSMSMNYE